MFAPTWRVSMTVLPAAIASIVSVNFVSLALVHRSTSRLSKTARPSEPVCSHSPDPRARSSQRAFFSLFRPFKTTCVTSTHALGSVLHPDGFLGCADVPPTPAHISARRSCHSSRVCEKARGGPAAAPSAKNLLGEDESLRRHSYRAAVGQLHLRSSGGRKSKWTTSVACQLHVPSRAAACLP